jgi:hypothetical protein
MLPRHQISESQRGTAESLIEPDAAIMQGYFGGQADLKAVERVWGRSRSRRKTCWRQPLTVSTM